MGVPFAVDPGRAARVSPVSYHQWAMHLADPIFIFILALVLLGPKKTGELGQQLGKLMGEFRKASNDFKFQFSEEMRASEQQEQASKQEAGLPAPENRILPPSEPAASPEAVPFAVSATTGEQVPVEDHPLLRVDVIPPMDGSPADQTSTTAVTPAANGHHAREYDETGARRG